MRKLTLVRHHQPLGLDVILASVVVMALSLLVALVLWKNRCDRIVLDRIQSALDAKLDYFGNRLPPGYHRDTDGHVYQEYVYIGNDWPKWVPNWLKK